MRDYFELKKHGTNVSTEIIAGFTTFLTISYILTVNPTILKNAGMPFAGVFIATGLSAGICTLINALYANTPFASAPGMGLNSIFVYTICLGTGTHWREALAITFIAGILHFLFAVSNLRKHLIIALPDYLRFATGGGIGLFIAYVGIKNSGILVFSNSAGHYALDEAGGVMADSMTIPSLVSSWSYSHLVFCFSLVAIIYLLALEKKTGDKYGAFLIGIISATFIGIPLSVTDVSEMRMLDIATITEIREILLSFFSSPGLPTIFDSPTRTLTGILICLLLLLTNLFDSAASITGSGQLRGAAIFGKRDMDAFRSSPEISSKLDKALIANSFGGIVSGLLGSSTCTVYIESVTGIAAGGRTGLTALVIGLCFFLCIPLVGFFSIIPTEAVAPALIVSGVLLLSLTLNIRWRNIEESIPAGLTIMFIPLTYNILNGIAAGVLSHIIIQVSVGNRSKLNIRLLFLAFALVIVYILRYLL